jgi:Tol biopolymer transport system component
VFESSRNGSSQIWVVDADGHNLRHLTDEGLGFAPSWSGFLD